MPFFKGGKLMPEYLSPGVYVEETSFRSKSIEGVSTSTAGFVGPARWGPISGEPELITNLADFERIYGGFDNLMFNGVATTNYLWHVCARSSRKVGSGSM
jgi:phage tail sheath protein FI